jgi:replication-associated recombination protein RarA
MQYNLKTKKGYDFFEVSSAFQKSIRRGLESEAMYWAVELFNSNYSEYIWKRIKIISSEDVGFADPCISSEIQSLYEMFSAQAKKKDEKNAPERLFLTHAVLMLCRARKSRLVDWALIHYWKTHELEFKPIPDFAYDKHNDKGRILKRSWKHFFEEGTRLENRAEIYFEEEYRNMAIRAISNQNGDLFD